jgi:hypothetical protein
VTFAFRDDGTTHNVTSTAGRRLQTIGNRPRDRSAGRFAAPAPTATRARSTRA